MSAHRGKAAPPILSRATEWTVDRISALSGPEVKQLRDNALRLAEPEIAAVCEQVLTQQRRNAIAARKALPPKPPKAKAPKPAPE